MRTLPFIVAVMLVAQPARLVGQDLITFRFHGVINQIQIHEGPAPPGVAVGSSFDGIYSFDPAAADSANYDYHGIYHTSAPSIVQASIEDLHWHADKSVVAIINGEPGQTDIYEAGASRITLDSPPELAELLDIWSFQLTVRGDGDNLSDASLLLTPPKLSQWSEARLLMIGESSTYSGLDPMPAVMITASLTDLGLAGDFQSDVDVDADDLAVWQATFGVTADSDADADGDSDGADFLAWQRQLGAAAPGVSANASVPEPSTSMLVTVAAIGFRRIGGRLRRELVSA